MPNLSNVRSSLGTRNGKLIGFFALLVLLAAIPLTLQLVDQVQDLRQRAAGTVCTESGTDTVLVIDKSNSMNWSADPNTVTPAPTVEPTRTRFYQAKVAAKAYADIIATKNAALPDASKHKVAVVSFSNSAKTTIDAWLTTDMNLLKQQIDAIVPGDNVTGSTCLECGVKKASIVLGVSVQGQNPSSQPMVVNDNEDSLFSKAASIIAPPVYAACSDNRDCNGTGRPWCVQHSCVECRNPGSSNDCNNPNNVCNANHQCVPKPPTPTPFPTRPGPTVVNPVDPITATPTLIQTTSPSPIPSATPAPTSANNARPDLKNVVIILTDGKANFIDGGTQQLTDTALAEQKALEAVMAEYTRSNTSYFTIALGAPTEINEPFLKNISAKTQGAYYYTPDADQLTSIYSTIAQTVGKGTISGVVFNDINKNGIKDSGEGGWPNFEVKALTGSPETVASTSASNAEGIYTLTGLCNGTYKVQQTAQSGYTQTSPVNPATYTVTLTTTDNQFNDKHFGTVVNSVIDPLTPPVTITDVLTPPVTITNPVTPPVTITEGVTITPPPTGTLGTGFTFNSLLLHGIGVSGDNFVTNPDECKRVDGIIVDPEACLSNQNPKNPERTVFVEIYDTDNQLIEFNIGTVTYDPATGSFKGDMTVSDAITTGTYIVKVSVWNYLKRAVPTFVNITQGQKTSVSDIELIAGDVDGDNRITILDYSIIDACYVFPGFPATCSPEEGALVDLNDDGVNDDFDRNLFRRELSVQNGD